MTDDPDLQGQRRDLREVYIRAWRKHLERRPLEPLEALLVDVIGRHPEYHGLLSAEGVADRDFHEETGGTNPFVHLGLHVALREQVAADRPPGIRVLYEGLAARFSDPHALEHAVMECLVTVLWEAQSRGGAPDEAQLLECMRGLA
ncbi:MAG: DUF1841 family protein [Gammaproteobacteria bacterium]|nr:DUF1841 family protein [Gammaproteobacteria bacterium]